MLAGNEGRPPACVPDGIWGDRLARGGWVLLRPDLLGSSAMPPVDALARAEDALLHERRPLNRDEVLAVAHRPLDELPDLVALAHRVRLAYCGPEVELESLINAKSGACPEDCAFCSQSARHH